MHKYIRVVSTITLMLGIWITPVVAQSALVGRVTDSDSTPLAGATLVWVDTNTSTATDVDGRFKLHRVKDNNKLVVMLLGFRRDTIDLPKDRSTLEIELTSEREMESIVIKSSIGGNYISQEGIAKDEIISFAGLCKMACCNLAESFENSASVTVGYSDAISGARQIQMLGLAGMYTQILDENRPIMRGISAPYALSYTPGMWLNSIQISKGISSVTAGHEAITGQINLEHRKPTDSERLFLNLYLNDELRPEINLSSATPVGKSGKLSTVVLAHASADTDLVESDHNGDGFRDMPLAQLYSVANRWSYLSDSGVQLRWGAKLLTESRLGGMTSYEKERREWMVRDNIYGSEIENRGVNGYFKVGAPVGAGVYDYESGEELRSSIALVADVDWFDESAYFGLNDYAGRELSGVISLIYNRYLTTRSSFIVGVSSQLQSIDETVTNKSTSFDTHTYDLSRDENEVGVYGEYTYKAGDHLSLIAGIRGDYNAYFDTMIATPRGQIKWSPFHSTTLRASAGMGHRTSNVITDNIGILATGREVIFESGMGKDFDRQERALTYGGSITQRFGILSAGDATFSVDYFRTDFSNSVIVDQEWDNSTIRIYNSQEPVTTDSYQVDFSWNPIEGFDIFTTFRYTDSQISLLRPDGTTYEAERPLVSKYKGLLNLQYATHLRRWVFDATAQLNGTSRLPTTTGDMSDVEYSPRYPMFYAQVSRKISAWEIYAGCENIGNYMQPNPIIGVDDPFSTAFNSSMVWGPLMGRKFYIGARFNLY